MIKELYDMMTAITAWKLVDEISTKLSKRIHNETLIEIMFWHAIQTHADPALIIRTLYENIEDNETMVANIIGNQLTTKIKNYVSTTANNLLP